MATRSEVVLLVAENLAAAAKAADEAGLAKFAESYGRGMVADIPKCRRLRLRSAEKAWSAVLFVDMRGSTERAKRIGPRNTFLTMHAFLPTMAFLAGDAGGYVVGFRGDGLFAAFGINEHGVAPADLDRGKAVQSAASCGQSMQEAVKDIINPILARYRLSGDLAIGVGVDAGDIVITRIGIEGAHEVTAYGDAINMASRLCEGVKGEVWLSPGAEALYPTSVGGQVRTEKVPAPLPAYRIIFPGPKLE
jgi:class 3 adenylate cyclase